MRARPGSTPISSPRASASPRAPCATCGRPASTTSRSRSRTPTPCRPTISPAIAARSSASMRSPPRRCGSACRSPSIWSCTAPTSSASATWSISRSKLKASRIEIAHVQYYGWALKNRSALMPTAEQVTRAVAEVEELRRKHQGRIVIDAVVPDYHARFPKPCVGGWGRRSLNVTPSGRVLPCHAARVDPGPGVLERPRPFAGRHLGRIRRPSTRSAAPISCRRLAPPANGARSISAAAAARPSC